MSQADIESLPEDIRSRLTFADGKQSGEIIVGCSHCRARWLWVPSRHGAAVLRFVDHLAGHDQGVARP
jgi:hypothetical protein